MNHRGVAACLLLVAVDQVTKAIAVSVLDPAQVLYLPGGWAGLSLYCNEAFVYGIGSGVRLIRPLTVVATLGALGLMCWLYRTWLRTKYSPVLLRLFVVLFVSGACGNLLDRLVLGCIRDFLVLRWVGAVNLADIYVTASLAVLPVALRRKQCGQGAGSH